MILSTCFSRDAILRSWRVSDGNSPEPHCPAGHNLVKEIASSKSGFIIWIW